MTGTRALDDSMFATRMEGHFPPLHGVLLIYTRPWWSRIKHAWSNHLPLYWLIDGIRTTWTSLTYYWPCRNLNSSRANLKRATILVQPFYSLCLPKQTYLHLYAQSFPSCMANLMYFMIKHYIWIEQQCRVVIAQVICGIQIKVRKLVSVTRILAATWLN